MVEYPGSTSGVSYEIANFKQEPVSSLVDSDGTVHEFTIQKYCELCKTHQFNLYLLVKENPEVEDEQVKEDDGDLLIPVFGSPVEQKIPNLSLEAGQTECQPVVSSQFYHASSMSSVDKGPEETEEVLLHPLLLLRGEQVKKKRPLTGP